MSFTTSKTAKKFKYKDIPPISLSVSKDDDRLSRFGENSGDVEPADGSNSSSTSSNE